MKNNDIKESIAPQEFLCRIAVATAIAVFAAYLLSLSFYGYQIESEGFNFQYGYSSFSYGLRLMFGVTALLVSLSFFWAAFVNLQNNRSMKIIAGIVSILSICFMTPFESKNSQIDYFAHNTYYQLDRSTSVIKSYANSVPGKALKAAIDTKNYESIKQLVKDPYDYIGLADEVVFEKLIIVQSINNQAIRDKFNEIYSDKYITKNEYNDFKEKAMNTLTAEIQKPIDNHIAINNDNVLIGKL